jgi:orotate phosphoribosyltransferase
MFVEEVNSLDEKYDVIFGPAYKGIPLASGLATQLGALNSKPFPVCFDRKEEKTHGEGGSLIGNVDGKRVLVIDDVLTAGTALKNSINLVKKAGGEVVAAVIALDREEASGGKTAREGLQEELNMPIKSIASISNLLSFLEQDDTLKEEAKLIREYYSNN